MNEWILRHVLGLSRREKWLVGGLVAVALPLAIGFLGLAPLYVEQARAAQSERAAHDLHSWVLMRDAEAEQMLATAPVDIIAYAPMGLSGLEQSLVEADLRDELTVLTASPEGGVTMAFEAVDFVELTGWLDAMALRWGYEVTRFSIGQTDAAGIAAASFELETAR